MSDFLSVEEKQVLRKIDGGGVDEGVDEKWGEGTGGQENCGHYVKSIEKLLIKKSLL